MEVGEVLIVGGTGYLGQFLLSGLIQQGWKCRYTYSSSKPLPIDSEMVLGSFQVDLGSSNIGIEEEKDDHGDLETSKFDQCFQDATSRIVAVINCAAISQPKACEQNSMMAEAINIPTELLKGLRRYKDRTGRSPLLIHLSTDQVYSGEDKSYWDESDPCQPVNVYGRSKLKAEQKILDIWSNSIILRSSIIYGPLPPFASVGRSLFLQFVDNSLANGKSTDFFEDEWRCPIYVKDIVSICLHFVENAHEEISKQQSMGKIFCMGGPERLNRVDIAHIVCQFRGYDPKYILKSKSKDLEPERGYKSPQDISMASFKLQKITGIELQTLQSALKDMWG